MAIGSFLSGCNRDGEKDHDAEVAGNQKVAEIGPHQKVPGRERLNNVTPFAFNMLVLALSINVMASAIQYALKQCIGCYSRSQRMRPAESEVPSKMTSPHSTIQGVTDSPSNTTP